MFENLLHLLHPHPLAIRLLWSTSHVIGEPTAHLTPATRTCTPRHCNDVVSVPQCTCSNFNLFRNPKTCTTGFYLLYITRPQSPGLDKITRLHFALKHTPVVPRAAIPLGVYGKGCLHVHHVRKPPHAHGVRRHSPSLSIVTVHISASTSRHTRKYSLSI